MASLSQKHSGAYFTPDPVVATLVRWAVSDPADRMLDTLSIQSSIAQSIASSLSLTLSLRDKAAIVGSGTANYLAHDLYLQANATFLVAGEEESKIRQTQASADGSA